MAINRSKEWWIARARSEGDMPVGAGVPDAQPTEDALVKHMVDRFLSWRLPEAFHPDGGISFKPTFNERTAYPMKAEPTGTNLFSAEQATAMVRHMLDGSDPTPAAAEARAPKATLTHFALREGGQWYPWDWNPPDRTPTFALKFSDGSVYDRAVGWRNLPPPEAKDGAAPSPETGWRLVPLAVLAPFLHAAKHIDFFVQEAIPEMAFPVRGTYLTGDGPGPFTLTPDNFTALARVAAAPAAPSPDLAALEELAGRLERFDRLYADDARLLRTAILHLKAQPNAGPSADGGKRGKG